MSLTYQKILHLLQPNNQTIVVSLVSTVFSLRYIWVLFPEFIPFRQEIAIFHFFRCFNLKWREDKDIPLTCFNTPCRISLAFDRFIDSRTNQALFFKLKACQSCLRLNSSFEFSIWTTVFNLHSIVYITWSVIL